MGAMKPTHHPVQQLCISHPFPCPVLQQSCASSTASALSFLKSDVVVMALASQGVRHVVEAAFYAEII